MKIDKKLLDIIKNFKQVDCKLTIEDVAKSIKLLKGIDIKKMSNSNLDSQKDALDFLDSQVKLSEKINKIELNYLCMIKDINNAITHAIVTNLKDNKNKEVFDSDINQIKLNSIKAFTDLYHGIVKELSGE